MIPAIVLERSSVPGLMQSMSQNGGVQGHSCVGRCNGEGSVTGVAKIYLQNQGIPDLCGTDHRLLNLRRVVGIVNLVVLHR